MRNTLISIVIVVAGCGPQNRTGMGGNGVHAGDMGAATLTSLEIMPASVSLTTTLGGAVAAQQFTALAHYSDGTTADVSNEAGWSLSEVALGTMTNGAFAGNPTRGGSATLEADDGSVKGTATIDVKFIAQRVSTDDGSTAPANSPTMFGGADDPTLAPPVAYPLDGATVPHNLGLLEVQWNKPSATTDLYEVAFTAKDLDFRLYTNAPLQTNGGRLALKPSEWSSIADTVAGGAVTVQVRAVASSNTAKVGSSQKITMNVGAKDVSGGLYYWAATGGGGATTGSIIRHAFGDTTSSAAVFYAPMSGTTQRCVGCHVISRQGDKMAVTYDGGNGNGAILGVPALGTFFAESSTQKWNFAAYSPDGNRMVTAGAGTMKIIDTSGGAQNGMTQQTLGDGSPGKYFTHPDWSADGSKIVFVSVAAPTGSGATSSDWQFSQGSIVVMSDTGMGVFGNPQVIVQSKGENNYYPSFSPDGKWILFNRTSANSYSVKEAEVYVVSADGKIGPIALGNANSTAPNITNSWPRWNPFVQHEASGDVMYFTFSSERDYGIELVGLSQPQVWMAAFDPAKAAAGMDPSASAFWMPYQDVKSHNHIAQWSATFIP